MFISQRTTGRCHFVLLLLLLLFWEEREKQLRPYFNFVGPCRDYDPRCPSLVLAGWCDYPDSFSEEINFRDYCMASCGFCNKLVKQIFFLQILICLISDTRRHNIVKTLDIRLYRVICVRTIANRGDWVVVLSSIPLSTHVL